MTRDEMKNKISLALKDPILQQGFECICKENAVLKDKIGMLDLFCGVDSFKQRRLDTFIQIANYIEKLEKENAELKKDNSEWEKASDKWKSVYELTNKQLANVKEIIKIFLKYEICTLNIKDELADNIVKAKAFLKREVEK